VRSARLASAWSAANRHLFSTDIDEPWIVTADDAVIDSFLNRWFTQSPTAPYDFAEVRDHFLFNFVDATDMRLFMTQSRLQHLQVNVALNGQDFINNVNFF